jgi:hypothetical protein
MTYRPDAGRYLRSLGDELAAQARRIRDPIGDAHWLSDGHHKEYLLASLLLRHLPSGILASRGFVVSSSDYRRCSREQDILVVDTQAEAPLFNQGGLVVTFPQSVLAAISIKTKLQAKEVKDVDAGLVDLQELVRDAGYGVPWCGGFFYEVPQEIERRPEHVYDFVEAVKRSPDGTDPALGANLICTAQRFAYKYVLHEDAATGKRDHRVLGYDVEGGAAGLTVALLADVVAASRQRRADFVDYFGSAEIRPLQEPHRIVTSV